MKQVLSREQVALMVATGWTLATTPAGDVLRKAGADPMPFEYEDEEDEPALELAQEAPVATPEPPPEPEPGSEEDEPGEEDEEPEDGDDGEDPADGDGPLSRDELPRDSKGRRRSPKSTVQEHGARISEVYVSLLNGASRQEILGSDAVKEWGVSERQLSNYIAAARKQFTQTADYVKKEEFGKALARYNDLYGRFFALDDWRGCQGVQRELVELMGLSEAKPAPMVQITNVKVDVLLQSRAWMEVQNVLVQALADEPAALKKAQVALLAYAEKEG